MRIYCGWRTDEGCVVHRNIEGRWSALPLALDVANHSPTGPNWGYGGSGPAQLALALAVDVLNDRRHAQLLHQSFKCVLMPRLPNLSWCLNELEVQQMLRECARRSQDVPSAFLFARNLSDERKRLQLLHGALAGHTDEEGTVFPGKGKYFSKEADCPDDS